MVAPFSEQRKFHRTAVGKLRINLRLERKSRKLPKVAAKLKEMQDFIKSWIYFSFPSFSGFFVSSLLGLVAIILIQFHFRLFSDFSSSSTRAFSLSTKNV